MTPKRRAVIQTDPHGLPVSRTRHMIYNFKIKCLLYLFLVCRQARLALSQQTIIIYVFSMRIIYIPFNKRKVSTHANNNEKQTIAWEIAFALLTLPELIPLLYEQTQKPACRWENICRPTARSHTDSLCAQNRRAHVNTDSNRCASNNKCAPICEWARINYALITFHVGRQRHAQKW